MASSQIEYSFFDPEFRRNAFIQSSYLPGAVILSYILFCKVIGPRIMKDREAMDLKLIILVYNFAMVVANVFLSYEVIKSGVELWPYRCDFKNSPVYSNGRGNFFKAAWFYLIVKYAELFDTVFFVLRKKFNQISFLHVYHHSGICCMMTLAVKYDIFGWYQALIGSLNSVIHVILYSYYTLSALGPGVRKYLWWKKYLTTLQIAQFFVYLLYLGYGWWNGCHEFDLFVEVIFVGIVLVTLLFFNFYYHAYNVKKLE